MPYKLNLVHFFSYENSPKNLDYALSLGYKYGKDSFKKSPIDYAIERNSFNCSQILLSYIMDEQNIYTTLTEDELTSIIRFSPGNL